MKVAKLNKDMILHAALRLISKQGGSAALTIRDVAKELGCSHPNIYNYYSSMLALRWDCLLWAINEMLEETARNLSEEGDSDTRFKQFFLFLCSYFLERQDHYRLIWFDPMGEAVPDYALPSLQAPGLRLRDYALNLYPQLGNPQVAAESMLMIHRYFHGEMSAIISGRVPLEDANTVKKRVAHNCLWLMRAFIKEIQEDL